MPLVSSLPIAECGYAKRRPPCRDLHRSNITRFSPACPNVHTIALPNAVVQRSSEMLPGVSNTAMLLLLLTSRVPVATATAPEAQRWTL